MDANFFDQPEMLGEPIATLRLLHYEGIESIAFILGIDTEFSQQPHISCTEFNIPHLGFSLKFSIFACSCWIVVVSRVIYLGYFQVRPQKLYRWFVVCLENNAGSDHSCYRKVKLDELIVFNLRKQNEYIHLLKLEQSSLFFDTNFKLS